MSENGLESLSTVRAIRILALCDSPVISSQKFVLSTGFGRVARNILGYWADPNFQTSPGLVVEKVDCWAINFNGWGYQNSPVQLYPAGTRWNSPQRLQEFLQFLVDGEYTHLWILMDPDALSVHSFPSELKKVCAEHGIRTLLYYPVDAPLEKEWLEIVRSVDVAVAYTKYGRDMTRQALGQSLFPIEVIPHGVDEIFRPLPVEQRAAHRSVQIVRKGRTVEFIQPDDFFILNVNKNEWRKDPLRSLEILKGLRERGVPAKLVLRMDPMTAMGGIHVDLAAKQLGLTYGREYIHISDIPDENLAGLYNAADLYLTTSLGEGWGLGVTEAMACHCPVAMPSHTSLPELGEPAEWLMLEEGFVCGADTRLRRRVHLAQAIGDIHQGMLEGKYGSGVRRRQAAGWREKFSWVAAAEQMFRLLMGGAA